MGIPKRIINEIHATSKGHPINLGATIGYNGLDDGDTVLLHTRLMGGSHHLPSFFQDEEKAQGNVFSPHHLELQQPENHEGYSNQPMDEEEEKEDWVSQPPMMPPTLVQYRGIIDKQTQTMTNDIYDQMRKDLNKTKELLIQS